MKFRLITSIAAAAVLANQIAAKQRSNPAKNSAADNCLAEGKQSALSATDTVIIFSPPTEEEGEP